MKTKLIMVVITMVAFTFSGNSVADAQTGVKGGLNLANVDADFPDEFDTSYRTGLAIGLFHHFEMSESFGFRPELMYVQKGYAASGSFVIDYDFFGETFEMEVDTEIQLELDYVDFVLPAIYMINPAEQVSPQIFAGPYAGFNVGATTEVSMEMSAEGISESMSESEDISDEVSSLDYGLIFGGGIRIQAGAGHLTADIRYNLGLADILEEVDDFDDDFDDFINGNDFDEEPDDEIFNRGIMLTIGYQF